VHEQQCVLADDAERSLKMHEPDRGMLKSQGVFSLELCNGIRRAHPAIQLLRCPFERSTAGHMQGFELVLCIIGHLVFSTA
jgi:hypothetical protein